MTKLFMKLIAVALVVSLFTVTNLQALADGANDPVYISEIKMATCDSLEEAKEELEGYIVVESNINEGMTNNAQQVYLGYKTTKDKSKAITDLRMMDMNGGYSYSDYDKVLKEQLSAIKTEIESFFGAVKEFRKNYAAGMANAKYAYKLMNQFKDDDNGDKLLGDLFLDENIKVDDLTTIFLQGNGSAVTSIEQALAIACADNWLERLQTNSRKVYGADAAVLDEYCEIIRLEWDNIYAGLTMYDEQLSEDDGYNMSEYSTDTYKEWLKTSPSEEMQNCVYNYGAAYTVLENYNFKGGTLLDYFLVDKATATYDYLYPMADAMTLGQIQTLPFIHINRCISYSQVDYSEWVPALEKNEDTLGKLSLKSAQSYFGDSVNISLIDSSEPASVYDGVDRSLFKEGTGVALTNDTLREMNSSDDKSTISQVLNNSKVSVGVCAAVGVPLIIAGIVSVKKTYDAVKLAKTILETAQFALKEAKGVRSAAFITNQQLNVAASSNNLGATQTALLSSSVFLGVAIGLFLLSLSISIYSGYLKYMNPTYKVVPRAIVDQKEEKLYNSNGEETGDVKKTYVPYYPVKDIVADKEHGEYADMNAWKAQQWNVMYYTTNEKAGQPILADTFVVQVGNSKRPDGYTAFGEFGVDVAADVNKHAFEEVPGVFIYYKTAEAKTTSGLASVFSNGYYAVAAVAGLVVGALGMFGVGTIFNKKKRKKETTAEA